MLDPEMNAKLKSLAKDEASLRELSALLNKATERAETAERNLSLLEAAIRNDYDSIIITDLSLESPGPKIVYVNDGFSKMSGYSREEVIGKTPRILQGPKTDRAVLDKLKKSLANGQSFFGQTVNYRKDGSEFLNQWDIHPLIDNAGKITHWVSYQHDITERKRAELSIFDTNAENEELYEQSKSTIIDFAQDGTVIAANKSFREMLGFKKEELRDVKIWELMPTKYGKAMETQFERLWEDEFTKGSNYRMMLRHRNGLPIQVEIQTKNLELNNGSIVRGDIRNLSLRKRVLDTLKKRNSDYNKLFERKVDFNYGLILDENQNLRFKWISDGFQRVTGYSVDECLSADGWSKLVHPEDVNMIREHMMKAFDGRSSTENYRIVTKTGEIKKIMDYAKPDALDANGAPQAVVASAIDVTNRKESTV
jgi:PAS domain S-box-containing protein